MTWRATSARPYRDSRHAVPLHHLHPQRRQLCHLIDVVRAAFAEQRHEVRVLGAEHLEDALAVGAQVETESKTLEQFIMFFLVSSADISNQLHLPTRVSSFQLAAAHLAAGQHVARGGGVRVQRHRRAPGPHHCCPCTARCSPCCPHKRRRGMPSHCPPPCYRSVSVFEVHQWGQASSGMPAGYSHVC